MLADSPRQTDTHMLITILDRSPPKQQLDAAWRRCKNSLFLMKHVCVQLPTYANNVALPAPGP